MSDVLSKCVYVEQTAVVDGVLMLSTARSDYEVVPSEELEGYFELLENGVPAIRVKSIDNAYLIVDMYEHMLTLDASGLRLELSTAKQLIEGIY